MQTACRDLEFQGGRHAARLPSRVCSALSTLPPTFVFPGMQRAGPVPLPQNSVSRAARLVWKRTPGRKQAASAGVPHWLLACLRSSQAEAGPAFLITGSGVTSLSHAGYLEFRPNRSGNSENLRPCLTAPQGRVEGSPLCTCRGKPGTWAASLRDAGKEGRRLPRGNFCPG